MFLGEEKLSCETCGGPSFDVPGILTTLDLEKEPRCVRCQQYVDATGKTVIARRPDGEATLAVIDGRDGARLRVIAATLS